MLIKYKDLPEKCKAAAKAVEDNFKEKEENLKAVVEAAGSTTVLLNKLKNLQNSYLEESGQIQDTKFGCVKCEWRGSTCCDPEKRTAKQQAQAKFAGLSWPLSEEDAKKLKDDSKYDTKVYNELKKQKKQEALQVKKDCCLKAFKDKMEAWSCNMQAGHKLAAKAKEAKAAKEATAKKAEAEATEVLSSCFLVFS